MYLYREKETHADLRPELMQVLLDLNTCDMQLYNAMLSRFNLQLAILKSHYFMYN